MTISLVMQQQRFVCHWDYNNIWKDKICFFIWRFFLLALCNSRKYPYLPQGRDFFLRPPTPLEISLVWASYISSNVLALQNLPPPRKFQSLLWGKYGYFLELNIIDENKLHIQQKYLLPWDKFISAFKLQEIHCFLYIQILQNVILIIIL